MGIRVSRGMDRDETRLSTEAMARKTPAPSSVKDNYPPEQRSRFRQEIQHLEAPFGGDSFGKKAEGFARFFGTPKFLIGQTLLVALWIAYNVFTGISHGPSFDLYPFILLNLMFSLQAAYAAPLILLAQTRQADRDKALAEADAKHREAIAAAAKEGMELIRRLLQENTELTERVESLTNEIHGKVVANHVASTLPKTADVLHGAMDRWENEGGAVQEDDDRCKVAEPASAPEACY